MTMSVLVSGRPFGAPRRYATPAWRQYKALDFAFNTSLNISRSGENASTWISARLFGYLSSSIDFFSKVNEKRYILFFSAKRFRTFLQICKQTYFCKYASRQTNASQPCPQSFSHFLRDEMEPLHPFTQTQQKGMFLCIPGLSCGRVQIIYKISVNLDTNE